MSDITTLEKFLSLIGFSDPSENVKHSRFAGAVWTNQAERFPFIEMHAQTVDGQQCAKALRDAAEPTVISRPSISSTALSAMDAAN